MFENLWILLNRLKKKNELIMRYCKESNGGINMIRKRTVSTIIIVMGILIGIIAWTKLSTTNTDNEKEVKVKWNEVNNTNNKSYAYCCGERQFDAKKIATDIDYAFSGTIKNYKEYEVEWTDENGEKWGPFPSTVLEVDVNKEYYGKNHTDKKRLRVYYPYYLSTVFDGSLTLNKNKEYVFLSKNFDKKFLTERKEKSPEDHFEQEKYADVYISDICYDVMDIEKSKILLHNQYLENSNINFEKKINLEEIDENKLESKSLVKDGWFKVMNESDLKTMLKDFVESNIH